MASRIESKDDAAAAKRCRAVAAEYERLRAAVGRGDIRADAPEWRQVGDALGSACRAHGVFRAGAWIYSWSRAERALRRLAARTQTHADRMPSSVRQYGGRLVKAPAGVEVPDMDWLVHESPLEASA